jgi:EF hand
MARSALVTPIARCGHGLGLLAFLLAVTGCAGAGAGGAGGSGGSGQCNDGSWCGDRLDRDQDNLISPQEWDDAFNAADTDHDGVVSQPDRVRGGRRQLGRGWTRSLKERSSVGGGMTLRPWSGATALALSPPSWR